MISIVLVTALSIVLILFTMWILAIIDIVGSLNNYAIKVFTVVAFPVSILLTVFLGMYVYHDATKTVNQNIEMVKGLIQMFVPPQQTEAVEAATHQLEMPVEQ